MSGPETTFYRGVHTHLPPPSKLHREKMSNPYSSGTADFWLSGKKDLWVEYKFVVLPKRDESIIDLHAGKKPSMSALQKDWLGSRHREGRNVWVIVGCKEGGVVFTNPQQWEDRTYTRVDYLTWMMTRQQIAQRLALFLEGR